MNLKKQPPKGDITMIAKALEVGVDDLIKQKYGKKRLFKIK